jgi:cytidine deaminase
MSRDETEEKNFGQDVRETFPLADVFFDASNGDDLETSLKRFQNLLFGDEYCTPSKDEYAMAHSTIAALRSASMARQVGAAIASEDGEIVAIGTNEVPRAGGGLYWEGDNPDGRDFKLGYDISDYTRIDLLGEVITKIREGGWLSEEQKGKTIEQLLDEALLKGDPPILKKSQLMNIIEYGRAVHAEMAAICFAARRGISLKDCTLYTTTFPCHECARHIVAAGIRKIVYIEPYPKSRIRELYSDSIKIDKDGEPGYVGCIPFIGVTPRLYLRLFSGDEKRRKIRGAVQKSDKSTSLPMIMDMPPSNIFANEKNSVTQLKSICDIVGIKIK